MLATRNHECALEADAFPPPAIRENDELASVEGNAAYMSQYATAGKGHTAVCADDSKQCFFSQVFYFSFSFRLVD